MINQDIADAIKRADVYQYFDWETNVIHLVSRNFEEPLTDDEKKRIETHLILSHYPFTIVFDN